MSGREKTFRHPTPPKRARKTAALRGRKIGERLARDRSPLIMSIQKGEKGNRQRRKEAGESLVKLLQRGKERRRSTCRERADPSPSFRSTVEGKRSSEKTRALGIGKRAPTISMRKALVFLGQMPGGEKGKYCAEGQKKNAGACLSSAPALKGASAKAQGGGKAHECHVRGEKEREKNVLHLPNQPGWKKNGKFARRRKRGKANLSKKKKERDAR